MSKRIVLSFPGCHRRGGVERILFECARYLASRGHEVTVLANEWDPDETQPSIRYQYVPMRKHPGFLYRASYLNACTRELGKLGYDVLNTHGCICPLGGVFRVHSVHRDWLGQKQMQRGTVSRLKQRLNPMHPVLLHLEARHFRERNYRKVIALSREVQEALNRYYNVPAADVEIVPNGFAPVEFNPERRAARRKEMRAQLGLADDQIALLFVANELERKGYQTILSAMAQLKRPDLRLLVVGRPGVESVRQQAAQWGLSEQVLACGSTRDVAGFHAAGDLFVLPTQYEAFCLAILEALGSGMPVVTTTVPGARDAIVAGVNGALISDPNSGSELAGALEPLLESGYRERLSEQTPETVRCYQWPVVLARYEEILLEYAT